MSICSLWCDLQVFGTISNTVSFLPTPVTMTKTLFMPSQWLGHARKHARLQIVDMVPSIIPQKPDFPGLEANCVIRYTPLSFLAQVKRVPIQHDRPLRNPSAKFVVTLSGVFVWHQSIVQRQPVQMLFFVHSIPKPSVNQVCSYIKRLAVVGLQRDQRQCTCRSFSNGIPLSQA